jgi:hypothetical protein
MQVVIRPNRLILERHSSFVIATTVLKVTHSRFAHVRLLDPRFIADAMLQIIVIPQMINIPT